MDCYCAERLGLNWDCLLGCLPKKVDAAPRAASYLNAEMG